MMPVYVLLTASIHSRAAENSHRVFIVKAESGKRVVPLFPYRVEFKPSPGTTLGNCGLPVTIFSRRTEHPLPYCYGSPVKQSCVVHLPLVAVVVRVGPHFVVT